ncbi:MAG: peptidoglycan-associated lipoprotein Pal [Gammaproteobacteria bacterium]|nr:peptidoglycan-associated lipoprotein Pal [Gammaproteobacteria bacterium]
MKKLFTAAAILSALALAGCASQPEQTAPAPSTQGTATSTTGTEGAGTQPVTPMMGQANAGPESSYENRVIYFDFNRSVVQPEFFPLLRRQADYLNAHAGAVILLEGYADERGTREYNIGLGARRAASVRKFLLLQGVGDDQIKTISYGEAYPADPGHNEAAWAKNRRVVINFHPDQGRSGLR